MSTQAWVDYSVPVSPYFILVDGPSGRIVGEGSGTSWEQVVALLARAAADGPVAPPAVSRPTSRLNGRERAALIDQELRGHGIEPGHASLYPDDPVTGGPPV